MADKPLDTLQIRISVLSGEANQSIKKLAEKIEAIGNVNTSGLNKVVDALERLSTHGESIRQLADSLKDIADVMGSLGRKSKSISKVAETAQNTAKATKDLSGSTIKAAQGVKDVSDAAGEAASKVDKASKAADGASKNVEKAGAALTATFKPLAGVKERIGSLIGAVKRIAFYRMVRSAIKAVTQALREGVSMLVEWDRTYGNNTSYAAKTADEIAAKWREVKKALGAAAMPLIQILQPALMSVMQTVINVANTINQVLRSFQGFSTYMKATDKGFKAATGSAKALKAVLFGFDELNVLPDQSGGGASASAGAIDFVPADIDSKIADVANTIKEKLFPVVEDIKRIFGAVWEVIRAKFKVVFGLLSGDWETVWNGLKEYLSGWGDIIAGIFKTLLSAMHRLLEPVYMWLYNHIWKPIGDFFSNLPIMAKNALTAVKNFFVNIWTSISNWFANTFVPVMKNLPTIIWESIKTGAQVTADFFKEIWGAVSTWVDENVITPVSDFFSGLWEKIKDGAKGAWDGIKNVFGVVTDWFRTKFTEAWTAVKNVFSAGGKIFEGIKDGIVNAFKTVVNAIIRGINKVISIPFNAINTVLAKIRDVSILGFEPFKNLVKTISVPQIPTLAKGGFVPNGVGSLFIAGEAGAELVTNAPGGTEVMNGNQVQEAMTNANMEVINALYAVANMLGGKIDAKNFDVYLDTQKVGKSVSQYQLNYARAMGV